MKRLRRKIQSVYLLVKRWLETFGLVAIYLNQTTFVGECGQLGSFENSYLFQVALSSRPLHQDESIICLSLEAYWTGYVKGS